MSRMLCATAALLLATAPLHAAGIERSDQSVGIIFEPGRLLEIGLSWAKPRVEGDYTALSAPLDIPQQPTGNVANSYSNPSFAYKQDFNDHWSGAIVIDQPLGAAIHYPVKPGALLGGTDTVVDSTHVTGILRWKGEGSFGLHGGARLSSARASVHLSGAAFDMIGLSSYHVDLDRAIGWGWLAGASWERPEIAARVALTYNSQITHDFDLTESTNDGPGAKSVYKVVTPRSWNLEFRTGVAPETLAFGSVRWVKWSELRLNPPVYRALAMPNTEAGIVELEDSTTWTLGIGRQFSESWAGAASVAWEKSGKGLVSPLAPTDGRLGLTLAGIYSRDNMQLTMGASWTRLGDADAKPDLTATDRLGVPTARMRRNNAFGFGIKTAFSF